MAANGAATWADIQHAYRGRRVVVLGATGFIGAWAAVLLGRAGADLRVVHRDEAKVRAALEAFGVSATRVRMAQADLTRPDEVVKALDRLEPEIVFNLAGYGVAPGQDDEATARTVNVEFVRVLAQALSGTSADEWHGQRLVHVGSGFEYGEIGGDLAEDSTPAPRSLYARTKLEGTRTLESVSSSSGLAAVTARPFTVYGPGEHPHRLLPSLLRALDGDEAVSLSAGTQQRDFVYVRDVVEALLRMGLIESAPAGMALNVATGALHSVREFAEAAGRVLGIDPDRLHFGAISTRVREMEHEPVSVARLREHLDWIPGTDIATGIAATREVLASRRP